MRQHLRLSKARFNLRNEGPIFVSISNVCICFEPNAYGTNRLYISRVYSSLEQKDICLDKRIPSLVRSGEIQKSRSLTAAFQNLTSAPLK